MEDTYENGEIPYDMPYAGLTYKGSTLLAELYYDPENINGCNELHPSANNKFVILSKEGCTLQHKTIRAQEAHAFGVLIAEEIEGASPEPDGLELQLSTPDIPCIKFNSDIQPILESLEKGVGVTILMKIHENHPQDRLSAEFWTSSAIEIQHGAMASLSYVINELSSHIDFQVKFYTVDMSELGENADCVSNGKYCSPSISSGKDTTGLDVMLENLRWHCVQKQGLFWEFLSEYKKQCGYKLKGFNMESSCVEDIFDNVGIKKDDVEYCIRDSFETENWIHAENRILYAEQRVQEIQGITNFPSLHFSGQQYKFKMDDKQVMHHACNLLKEKPWVCVAKDVQEEITEVYDRDLGMGLMIGMSVAWGVTLFLATPLVTCFCLRRLRRKLHSRESSYNSK